MGIQGLSDHLKKVSGSRLYKRVPASYFRGKRIAVDMNQLVYVCCYGSAKRLVNNEGNIDDEQAYQEVIILMMKRLLEYMAEGIELVCVFDGSSLEEKSATLEKRRESRQRIEDRKKKAQGMGDIEQFKKLCINSYHLPYSKIEKIARTLDDIGFDVFWLDDTDLQVRDGEAFCASLCYHGYCAGAITTDTDFHPFGGEVAIVKTERSDVLTPDGDYVSFLYFDIRTTQDILECLELNYDEFVEMCVLMGNDYNKRIRNVGPVRCHNLIKEHKRIENIPGIECNECHIRTREIFNLPKNPIDVVVCGFDRIKYQESGRLILEENYQELIGDFDMVV